MREQGGTVKRAFELARKLSTIDQIKARLREEGYEQVDAHLAGRQIKADLKEAMEN